MVCGPGRGRAGGGAVSAQAVWLEEIDRALAQRKIHLGRLNRRMGRCCVWGCALPIPSGRGRHLYVDGIDRGLVCVNHERGIIQTAHEGKAEIDV